MARRKVNLKLRLRFDNRTGAPLGKLGEVTSGIGDFLFENIVLDRLDTMEEVAVAGLEAKVERALRTEIDKFARAMARGLVGGADQYNHPRGTLNVSSSNNLGSGAPRASLGPGVGAPAWSVQSSGVTWAPRSKKYLEQKAREGYGAQGWFERQRVFHEFLSNGQELLGTFGPLAVTYQRQRESILPMTQGRNARGQFSKKVPLSPTLPGLVGRGQRSTRFVSYVIGRLSVRVFGRLTPEMLPALASGNLSDVVYSEALTSMLPHGVAVVVAGHSANNGPRRLTIQPYLSWFLVRAVPFAVLRQLDPSFRAYRT